MKINVLYFKFCLKLSLDCFTNVELFFSTCRLNILRNDASRLGLVAYGGYFMVDGCK